MIERDLFCSSAPLCFESASFTGVLLGNGDGTFETVVAYFSGGYEALWLAVGDVNGDDKPDVMVTNECGNTPNCSGLGTVAVLINTFAPIDTTPPVLTALASRSVVFRRELAFLQALH